jgi:hypothetical protein
MDGPYGAPPFHIWPGSRDFSCPLLPVALSVSQFSFRYSARIDGGGTSVPVPSTYTDCEGGEHRQILIVGYACEDLRSIRIWNGESSNLHISTAYQQIILTLGCDISRGSLRLFPLSFDRIDWLNALVAGIYGGREG